MALTKVRGSGIDADGQEIILDADTDTTITADTDDQIDFKTGGSDTFRVNSASVSIVGGSAGTASVNIPAGDILSDVGSGQFEIANLGDSSSELRLSSRGFVAFRTGGSGLNAGSERGRFDSAGRFLVSCTSEPGSTVSGVQLSDPGDFSSSKFSAGATADTRTAIQFLNGNGSTGTIQMSGTSTSYNTSSDYRLKENVLTEWDATSRLKQLKPSRFNFKADKDTTLDGFLAHEVSGIIPEAVSGEKDAVDKDGNIDPQGIDQSKLVPLLTKALQEAVAKIETLEAKVTALESK